MLKTMTYVFGVVGFGATTFLSAAVNLMTVALGASTLITAVVLNNALVRRTVGLPPHSSTASSTAPKQTTYEAPRVANAPEPGLRERLNNSLNDMKKGMSDQITNYTGTYSGTDEEKAERKRRELIRKLENTRKQQERDQFERKYKGKS
jgi:YidC/Oxa1 family membrane protein insertase